MFLALATSSLGCHRFINDQYQPQPTTDASILCVAPSVRNVYGSNISVLADLGMMVTANRS